jgi:hypothetical protein
MNAAPLPKQLNCARLTHHLDPGRGSCAGGERVRGGGEGELLIRFGSSHGYGESVGCNLEGNLGVLKQSSCQVVNCLSHAEYGRSIG